ncbi:MAG: hypothetical protein IJN17_02130 [Clostridia bacterium]|nr:hypothetical protein [Clostridia bacterium]
MEAFRETNRHAPKPLLWEGCLGVAETGWGLKISNFTSSPLPSAYGCHLPQRGGKYHHPTGSETAHT